MTKAAFDKIAEGLTEVLETARGREVWRVTQDGRTRTLMTSRTSAEALDRAAVRFDAALKRFVDR